jgi:hypothetical protein
VVAEAAMGLVRAVRRPAAGEGFTRLELSAP